MNVQYAKPFIQLPSNEASSHLETCDLYRQFGTQISICYNSFAQFFKYTRKKYNIKVCSISTISFVIKYIKNLYLSIMFFWCYYNFVQFP